MAVGVSQESVLELRLLSAFLAVAGALIAWALSACVSPERSTRIAAIGGTLVGVVDLVSEEGALKGAGVISRVVAKSLGSSFLA